MYGWVANLFCREKSLTLFYSVPLTMWASQHMEQCAIRNSILTEGVKSFVTPQWERFMCAVKPFEVNCILLSFCACNILCSLLYGDRGRCAPSLSLLFSSSFVPLCVQYHCVNTFSHLSLDAAFGLLIHLNASVPGHWRIISEVLRCVGFAGSCGGLRHSGCDRDSPPPPPRGCD